MANKPSHLRFRAVLSGLGILFFLFGQTFAREPNVRLNGWIVYWDPSKGEDFIRANFEKLDHISIFAIHFNADGKLIPAEPWVIAVQNRFRDIPLDKRPRLLLTIVNDVVGNGPSKLKDPTVVHERILSLDKIDQHVQEILAISTNVHGVEIDYENVWAKDRQNFSLFIERLSKALHLRGQTLSVVVQPKEKEVSWDGAGAFDWRVIGQWADQVKIMAYYLHYPGEKPGPPAPPDWVESVARYAISEIPPEKICVALSLSGFDWTLPTNGKMVSYDEAHEISAKARARVKHHSKTNTPFFKYKENRHKHEVWFADIKSVATQVQTLKSMGVNQIGIWRFGTGDPKIWPFLVGEDVIPAKAGIQTP